MLGLLVEKVELIKEYTVRGGATARDYKVTYRLMAGGMPGSQRAHPAIVCVSEDEAIEDIRGLIERYTGLPVTISDKR